MLAWLAPVLVLGLVIFVHELGHFVAAKVMGVYAPRFSLGWGAPIWRWRPRGSETEYVIGWLPLGGYVRMASRDDETMAQIEGGSEKQVPEGERPATWDPEAMVPHGPKPVPPGRWFESKPVAARVFIMLAGVTMNALLTVVVATTIYGGYGRQVVPAVVDTVVAGRPAEAAGFQRGDSITSVDGHAVRQWTDFLNAVSDRPDASIAVGLVRNGAPMTIAVHSQAVQEPDPATGVPRTVGRIGMGPVNRAIHEPVGLGEATVLGLRATWTMATAVTGVLGGLFQGTVGVQTLGGPIAIARSSVAAAKNGFEPLLTLIAFLSINLAVLNLLPIPVLDGGQIVLTVAEGIRGKPLTLRTREWLMRAGVAFILTLFVVVTFNDIKSLVLRFWQ
ncbi:MAG: RIP metalloprotease RseP [Gemmatimonadaceae bacterium]|nr:RIP metalloprotease RseP [Gemmatimonadaceae bacterium]